MRREHLLSLQTMIHLNMGRRWRVRLFFSPEAAKAQYPDATWVASIVRPVERHEIIDQIKQMGIRSEDMMNYLPNRRANPPSSAVQTILGLLGDEESKEFLLDQIQFRSNSDSYKQLPHSDINEIYFPDFISRRDDEHFVDCGAADGDTVQEFMKRWEKWGMISAFEPDPDLNFSKNS